MTTQQYERLCRLFESACDLEPHQRTLMAVAALIDLHDAWAKPDKAAEWRAKLPTEQEAVAKE